MTFKPARFLREINDKVVDVPKEFMENPDLNKAMELAQESSYTPEELEAYDKYWDAVRVEKTIALDSYAKGKEEEKLAIANAMIAEGSSVDFIQKVTQLPIKIIEGIKEGEVKKL